MPEGDQTMASVAAFSEDDLLDNPPRGLIYAAFCLVIVIQYLYIFTFNWFPGLRTPLSGTLAAIHVVLAGLTILIRPAAWNLTLLVAAALLVGSLIPAHTLGYGEVQGFDAVEAVRKLVPIFLMIWVLSYPLALPRRLLWWCGVLGTLLGVAIAFGGPPVYANYPRLASITGGLEQYKPSAKYVALQIILLDLLWRIRIVSSTTFFPLFILSFSALVIYEGRSEFVLVIIYFAALAYFTLRRIVLIKLLPYVVIILGITLSWIALTVGHHVNAWGSGRIGVWSYRLTLLAKRDLVPLIFGSGVGSDVIWTPQWGWDNEGFIAHNDYLYFLTEHGIVGLFVVFMILYGIWIRTNDYGRAVVMAVAVSSFFDNGYLRSPLLATCLGLVLAVSMLVGLIRAHPVPDVPRGASQTHAGEAAQ